MFFNLFTIQADEEAELVEITKSLQDHPSALECVAQECPDLLRKSKFSIDHQADCFKTSFKKCWSHAVSGL